MQLEIHSCLYLAIKWIWKKKTYSSTWSDWMSIISNRSITYQTWRDIDRVSANYRKNGSTITNFRGVLISCYIITTIIEGRNNNKGQCISIVIRMTKHYELQKLLRFYILYIRKKGATTVNANVYKSSYEWPNITNCRSCWDFILFIYEKRVQQQ